MPVTRRMEWNGNNWIIILDHGPHGRIEMTLDDFVALAIELKTDLSLDFSGEEPLPPDHPDLQD
ncbi:hypothetical protein [Mesorhizobium sp.]|uniref:hypothetical protein n=1 Tax=Mesorhizobium sp. TaxID=1871066 RepID=UPI001227ED5F|nr:hypothetical protein [Mesorhizobium sp.]TIM38304.1 MAG: hypothetical protein E5Y56_30225 [Mesorhizobium sp.]